MVKSRELTVRLGVQNDYYVGVCKKIFTCPRYPATGDFLLPLVQDLTNHLSRDMICANRYFVLVQEDKDGS